MNDKLKHILAAIISPVELTFKTPEAAAKYRLSLYHYRRIAALQDTRALRVKISLQNHVVTLTHDVESHPV